MSAPDREFDERGGSLYTERTDLAWSRSGLALIGAFALMTRRIFVRGGEPGDALVVALLGLAGLGWAIGMLGWRLTHGASTRSGAREPRQLFAIAAGTVALAGAGLAFTFVNT